MRNLKNVRLVEVQLQTKLPLTATAWDASSDSIICTFGPTIDDPVLHLRRLRHSTSFTSPASLDDLENIASWDAPCPLPDLSCDRVLSLQYFADNLTAILVLEGGDIVIVREDPQPGENKIEILGSVDVGITAAAWSPDEELLAITTRANTLLYMTREFENVAEISFNPEDLKLSRHVSVGWGKKETQFQGKRAKALRDPTMPEKVDEGKLSVNDDSRTTISWRGDGAFVAVNSTEAGVRRVIRVYSREGSLDSVSEPVDGLEGALSWKPSGNLIAGIQRLDDRVDVVFFERNGLRHGQFTLRLSEEERSTWASDLALDWNMDSTVLAVRFMDRIQLWTMGNYHYYLKQEIPIVGEGINFFRWHQEKTLRFIAAVSYSVMDSDWVFDVSHGSTSTPDDIGAVGVIDGKILKLTPLRFAAAPPPMAYCEINVDSNIVDVAFSRSGARIAVLTNNNFSIFAWPVKSKPIPAPLLESSYPLSEASGFRPRQIAFLGERDVYILSHHGPFDRCIERTTLETRETTVSYLASEEEHIHSIFSSLERDKLWFSKSSNKSRVMSYSKVMPENGHVLEITPFDDIPTVDTYWAASSSISGDQEILVSLTRTGALYANHRLLAKNCTSFITSPAHIIFTTTQHLLKFVHITDVDDMEVPADTPETDERCRSIERGGRIVTVTPSNFAVTLQMPRGNLETIYPRALVLAGIRSFIDSKNYRSAYLACRSQMVDMNILHDYAPKQFMENVALFITQVKKVEYIDEFLSRLQEEDVSQTLYKDTLKLSKAEFEAAIQTNSSVVAKATYTGSKINRICDAFLTALKNKLDTNLQNLVTAHVCKSPPDLDSGLQLVANLRVQNPAQAEEAIEHMCFLTDAYHLYNNALGLYDLELTLLVAQQAQKDPREYLPFLRNLQSLPELRRQFEIDNFLGRFTKALKHLHALNVYDELKQYAVKHNLYRDALELYKYQPDQLKDMTHLYADYLQEQNNHKEAAIAYESLELYEEAYRAYQTAHYWRESLFTAMMVPLSEEDLRSHAIALAATLVEENKDYISAAQIHADHLKDYPTAARFLCRGSRFADATRMLAINGLKDSIPDIVDSGLAEAMGSTTDFLADCKAQLNAQVPRILELREKREADPLAYFGGDPSTEAGGADIPDNVSLAPTDASTAAGRTMFTRYTGGTAMSRRTSKTRRKEERKRALGRKGTVYEEEYLVNSVRRLIERVNSTFDEVSSLLEGLLRRGMRERAIAVQRAFQDVLAMCTDSLSVFESSGQQNKAEATGATADTSNVEIDGQPPVTGGDAVLWDSIHGNKNRPAPVVREFAKLALLG
ncbi:putative killer toxin sensitivity protein [Talaromyces proteolyticus]|uniref:Elongator complex protein 1 n=1 Tax=Talaromyces proteolyticus TaxID=1131652 RepID=A0AAD4KS69_9EURO|nr:putative killer toxin sensitivity protein [Talaromyces proteolyticus]KAH8697212.1 putative killer toxin sensitivity protein [Talaromyces proteolyticus]